MKRRVALIALIIAVQVALFFAATRRRTGPPTSLDQAMLSNTKTWAEIPQRLSEEQFEIQDVAAPDRNFTLRIHFRAEDVGKQSTSKIITFCKTELPTGEVKEFRMDAESKSTMTSCAPDFTSGKTRSVTNANWASFGSNSAAVPVQETTETEQNSVGETIIHSMKTLIHDNEITSKLFGTASLRFPDEAVAVGSSWSLTSATSDDWPLTVVKEPPSLTATLEKIVRFKGIECALVRYHSKYYIESAAPASTEMITGQAPEIRLISSDAKAYVEIETGNILWAEYHSECEKPRSSLVTRVLASVP